MARRRALGIVVWATATAGCDLEPPRPRQGPPWAPQQAGEDDGDGGDDGVDAEPTEPGHDQPAPQGAPSPTLDPSPYQDKVTAIYLVPADQALVQARRDFFAAAMDVVAAWYATATGGESFAHDVTVVYATHPIAWFDAALGLDPCFGKLDTQLRELGYPVYAERTNFLVAVQGVDVHYGGAMADTRGGLELVGADSFQAVIDAGCAPGQCGINGLDGDGVTGGIAHELGHGLGLPHTTGTDAQRRWAVMAEHWHFPHNGFVGSEVDTIRNHPLVVGSASGPVCGDGVCGGGEDCSSCSIDCPQCDPGDGGGGGDDGGGGPICGDGWCDPTEDCSSCAADCACEGCTFACEDYGYADGQCVDGWLCTWPCIDADAC